MDERLLHFAESVSTLAALPIFHLKAGKAPTPPYACWYVSNDRNFYADDSIYCFCGWTVTLEIYSRKDGQGLEILNQLKKEGYGASLKDDNWMADENLWLTILEIEVNG
ncbi:MAG: hypothetical protein HDR44_02345 [Allobaculum sp.]|nr:hypothetical protein [Allobaculum sp.]